MKAIDGYNRLYNNVEGRRSYMGGDFFFYFHERSMVNYNIARSYEQLGDRKQAVLYYEKALDQWKNADDDLPEPHDARARLTKLKQDS